MSVLIKDIQRNANEIIRIEVSEFKGKELINIRIWYVAARDNDGNEIYKPTQKGIALDIAEFDELRKSIDKLAAYINDRKSGWFQISRIRKTGRIIQKVFLTRTKLMILNRENNQNSILRNAISSFTSWSLMKFVRVFISLLQKSCPRSSLLFFINFARLISPNSSPSRFLASVIPSV